MSTRTSIARLADLVEPDAPIQYGILQPGPVLDNGVPYVRPTEIDDDGGIRLNEIRKTSEEIAQQYRRASLQTGDLLITIVGTIGRIAVVPSELQGANITQSSARVRPKQGVVNGRYLYHALRSTPLKRQYDKARLGTGVPRLNIAHVRDLLVPVPCIDDQTSIARILDTVDAIRRKRREALNLTDDLLRSTFLEMFGDPVTNPKGWPMKALDTLVEDGFRNGLSPSTGGSVITEVLTLSAITQGAFDTSARKPGTFEGTPPIDKRVHERDFLVCRGNGNRNLVGSGHYPHGLTDSVVFPDTMIAFRPREESFDREFFEALWATPLVRRHIETTARTTNGTFKINQQALGATALVLPQLKQQQVFGEVAARIRGMAARMREAEQNAEQLFAALSEKFFAATGSGAERDAA